jgi:hypothetical protein
MGMGIWQGVPMDSLKFPKVPSWSTLLPPLKGPKDPKGGRPAAVFYPFGHPTPYAYGINYRPLRELFLVIDDARKFGRADGGVVGGVREQDAPRIPQPVVEVDLALSRLSLKVGEFFSEPRHDD